MIKKAKHCYYIDTIKASVHDITKLFQISNDLLCRILTESSLSSLPEIFKKYFKTKYR